ncbi:unnamed protein product [marine sediment metagenome]|uniref:Uncharacterized protein n=1 Tax=marine sediment metagenome TaxID=412755 RepID=X1RCR5_9ZZZZ
MADPSKPKPKQPRSSWIDPELDEIGVIMFEGFFKTFTALGYSIRQATHLANMRALEKQKEMKH